MQRRLGSPFPQRVCVYAALRRCGPLLITPLCVAYVIHHAFISGHIRGISLKQAWGIGWCQLFEVFNLKATSNKEQKMYHAQKNLWDLFPPLKNNNNKFQTIHICCLLCGQDTCLPLCCYLIWAYSACKNVNMNFFVMANMKGISSVCVGKTSANFSVLFTLQCGYEANAVALLPELPFLHHGPGGWSCCPDLVLLSTDSSWWWGWWVSAWFP